MAKRIILLSLWFIFIVGCQSNQHPLSFKVLKEAISLPIKTAQSDEVPDLIIIARAEETAPPSGPAIPDMGREIVMKKPGEVFVKIKE